MYISPTINGNSQIQYVEHIASYPGHTIFRGCGLGTRLVEHSDAIKIRDELKPVFLSETATYVLHVIMCSWIQLFQNSFFFLCSRRNFFLSMAAKIYVGGLYKQIFPHS